MQGAKKVWREARGQSMLNQVRQKAFVFRTWGGKRKGAGRKPVGAKAGVPHVEREVLAPRFPVHVTWRMEKGVWNEAWAWRSVRCLCCGVLCCARRETLTSDRDASLP